MNTTELENELRARWTCPYRWNGKQTNAYDRLTRMIYRTPCFADARAQIERSIAEADIQIYALNRWYNFWSSEGIKAIFEQHPRVTPCPNRYSKTVDFSIDGIPFDHKTTIFPRAYPGGLRDAIRCPRALIDWLYENQSTEQRYHTANRLFIVLYASDGQHWKLKANLHEIGKCVNDYLDHFDPALLSTLSNGARADCIWYVP